MMRLTMAQGVNAKIVAHGLNVYPLQGFGILLGETSASECDAHVVAALPVGNTEHWYDSAGRFSRIHEALALAAKVFSDWNLQPSGLYCSVYREPGRGETDTDSVLATAPRLPCAPWLLLRSVDGGEDIFMPRVWHLGPDGWREQMEWKSARGRPASATRNPRRIRTVWNRAWGVIDFRNHHETELPRLGLAPANADRRAP